MSETLSYETHECAGCGSDVTSEWRERYEGTRWHPACWTSASESARDYCREPESRGESLSPYETARERYWDAIDHEHAARLAYYSACERSWNASRAALSASERERYECEREQARDALSAASDEFSRARHAYREARTDPRLY